MNQTALGSFIEACMSTAIGFILSLMLAPIIYPLFGHSFSAAQNVGITAIYTIVSVLRSYVLRRWFNARLHRAALSLAAQARKD